MTTPDDDATTPRQAGPSGAGSPMARAALLAYLLLIVYASWFPFTGWRSTGLSPLAFLTLTLPRYWTVFDVVVNIVGYMPLGMLLVLALYPRVRGVVGGAAHGRCSACWCRARWKRCRPTCRAGCRPTSTS